MKKLIVLLISVLALKACTTKDGIDLGANITVEFSHHWDQTPVTIADFNRLQFITQNNDRISIEGLRYLVSNITLTDSTNAVYDVARYKLVDLGENQLTINKDKIPEGKYTLAFVFGFSDINNQDGKYTDLNSVNFNVPGMLGGGYHYMQFDGKFKNSANQDANFNFHAIRAVDKTDPDNLIFEDTSFEVNLGKVEITNNSTIEIKMNIAEWFKNPNTWNFNELNTVLMPNFEAQKMISANGKSVFSLGEVTP